MKMLRKLLSYFDVLIRATGVALMIFGGIAAVFSYRLIRGKDWQFTPSGMKTRQNWMRMVCFLMKLEVKTYGRASSKPGLIASNHISWIDILVFGASTPCAFVAKSTVLEWPVIGKLAQMAGTVFVDRDNRKNALAAMTSVTEFLEKGCSVVVFPEGTTSVGANVQTFHRLLFEGAVRGKYNTQAAALYYPGNMQEASAVPFIGDQSFGPHLIRLLASGRTQAEIYYCGPVHYHEKITRKELAETTQKQIERVLQHCETRERQRVDAGVSGFQTSPSVR